MNKALPLLFLLFGLLALSAQTISNIRITQDPDLGYYTITFDLSGKDGDTYLIKAVPYKAGKEIANPRFLDGRGVDTPCEAGQNLQLFWNPLLEGVDKDGWQFRLSAVTMPKNMVLVEGGTIQMGSNDGEIDAKPAHQVTVSSFWIGKYEVTQKEWKEVMGSNPSKWKGDKLPVESISWYEAVEFCNLRSRKEGLTPCYSGSGTSIICNWNSNGYRLPTEAEWEYAARGGIRSKGYKYSGSNDPGSVGWYVNNSGSRTHDVGGKAPNELGIYDMSGNVWEWCWDRYDSRYYPKSTVSKPTGADAGSYSKPRKGILFIIDYIVRVANRFNYGPDLRNYHYNFCGVRVARTP